MKQLFKYSLRILGYTAKDSMKYFRNKKRTFRYALKEMKRFYTSNDTLDNIIISASVFIRWLLLFVGFYIFISIITCSIQLHHQNSSMISSLLNGNEYDKFINYYKVPIGLAVAWVAIITLLINISKNVQTDKQLSLMEKQRVMSYRPDIYLSNCEYVCDSLPKDVGYGDLEIKLKFYNKEIPTEERFVGNEGVTLNIYNLGLAPAKNIKVQFVYDDTKVAKIANSDIIHVDSLENQYISFDTDIHIEKALRENYAIEYELKVQSLKFLLPEGKSNIENKVKVPDSFCMGVIGFLEAVNEGKILMGKELQEILYKFPKLYCKIDYEDIGYSKHCKYYELSPQARIYFTKLNEDRKTIRPSVNLFNMEVKEILPDRLQKKIHSLFTGLMIKQIREEIKKEKAEQNIEVES